MGSRDLTFSVYVLQMTDLEEIPTSEKRWVWITSPQNLITLADLTFSAFVLQKTDLWGSVYGSS
jgi:hypothetical protein